MWTNETSDPWDQLRRRSTTHDPRTARGPSSMITPDAAHRLYGAAAGVLSALGQLIDVAQIIVEEKRDGFEQPDRTAPREQPTASAASAKFTKVRVGDTGGWS